MILVVLVGCAELHNFQRQIQTFKKGGSTLELQLKPSCRLKTKKKKKKSHHLLTIVAPHHDALINYISLFIACYTTPQKTTVTALLEYLDLTVLLEYLK